MSGIIERLELNNETYCPGYTSNILNQLFVMATFFPIFAPVGMASIGLFKRDLYIIFVSLGLFLNDYLFNWILITAISDPVPFDECGGFEYGMPSFYTQDITFFFAMIVTFPLFYRHFLSFWQTFLLLFVSLTIFWAPLVLQFNTEKQVFVGGIIGFLTGFGWQLLYYYVVNPYDWIPLLILHWVGGYENRFCAPVTPPGGSVKYKTSESSFLPETATSHYESYITGIL